MTYRYESIYFDDPIVPQRVLDLNRRFIEKLTSLGARAEVKVYERVEHGFFYDVTRRQQKEAFADILAFIESLDTA